MRLGSTPAFFSVALVVADKVFLLEPFPVYGLGGMGGLVPFVSFLIPDVEG